MVFLETLYAETSDEGRIITIEPKTIPVNNFNTNLSGALLIPTLVY